jgi:hypothetical protein
MTRTLTGQCLCGAVAFSVQDRFRSFYQCHCKQCQRLTGSAFASNLLTEPDNIQWLRGEDNISSYEHPTRQFSKVFCSTCGSALPFVNKPGEALIVPAGSLDEPPLLNPEANIFTAEEAGWLAPGARARRFAGFAD